MNYAKQFWNYLDGKKTVIGAVVGNLVPWLVLKNKLDVDTAELVLILTNLFTGAGLLHKGIKARQG